MHMVSNKYSAAVTHLASAGCWPILLQWTVICCKPFIHYCNDLDMLHQCAWPDTSLTNGVQHSPFGSFAEVLTNL